MYFHIDQRIFETRPVLGLLLGAVTMVLTLVIYGVLYGEYKSFGKVPEEVDLKTVVPPRQDHGDGYESLSHWRCDATTEFRS